MHEVGILIYPGAQSASVHGLTDLFEMASRIALNEMPPLPPIRVTHWRLDEQTGNVSCVYNATEGDVPHPAFLIIPPTLVTLPDKGVLRLLADWLRKTHSSGVKLVSVCSGAFVLAETGLLSGRSVSTHTSCAAKLAGQYPDVEVDAQVRIFDHGDVISAGGFLAWMDVGLLLISQLLGEKVRGEMARFITNERSLNDPWYFSGFAPKQAHSDAEIKKAQEWVHCRDGRDVSVDAMAEVAGLQKRTFIRRFTNATGSSPLEYSRAVRIARARELLTSGNKGIKEIAHELGYDDLASFSRSFHKNVGIWPGEYRTRAYRPSFS